MKNIIKNKKAFVLPIILVIVSIITTASSYVILKNNFDNQNKKQESLRDEKQLLEKEEKEIKNQQQVSEFKENEKDENQKKENEKNQNKEEEKNVIKNQNKEDNQKKDLFEEKKVNYVDLPRSGGFTYIDTELNLSAIKEENGIKLTWSRCNSDQFVAYKIARSELASDVYYPRDGSIASINDQNSLIYFDNQVEKGKTYYYRICSFEKNGESWCGNVVSVTF